ncbi:MAG: hypothetical protein ABW184_06575 [Sphingobium sp.]
MTRFNHSRLYEETRSAHEAPSLWRSIMRPFEALARQNWSAPWQCGDDRASCR